MKKLILLSCIVLLGSSELFAVQVWNQKTNFGGISRHRTTSFTVGNKGYMGLGHYNSGPTGNILLDDFWEYDPASDSWTQKADFAGGLRYHAVGVGFDKKAYVGTGRGLGGVLNTDWWEFDPIANTWTPKTAYPGVQVRGAVAFLIDDLIFVGTGQTTSGHTSQFFAYNITNDQWLTGVTPFPGSPRTSASAFTINNKGYVGAGGIGCGTNDFYEYKLSSNTWIQRADIGTQIRQECVGFSVNGKGYIGAGDNCSSGINYKDMWEYDPQADTWIEIEEFAGSARRYLDGFVIGNKAYCGLGTSGVNYSDLWEFDQTLSIISRDVDLLSITSYPNPATDYVTFNITNLPEGVALGDIELKLFNSAGQEVFADYFSENNLKIDRNDNRSGIYIYSIEYENSIVKSGKLIFK